jgi:5,10-methylenetetrahydromethanopterin reductase
LDVVSAAGSQRADRRFHVGAAFFPPMGARDVSETARMVEDLGYDDLWIPDQSFHHDPFVLLTRCAAATSSIRLGIAVTNPLTRHPVQIARAAATLGELTGGRFVLGLGAGNRSTLLPSLDLPSDRAAVRIAEAIDVCRAVLRGDEVSFRGRTIVADGVRLEANRPPTVPIFVGARGRRVLRVAGSKADGVFAEAMFTPAGIDHVLAEVGAGAREEGRSLADLEIVAWQAIRLSTTLAARDDLAYRRWAALLMRGTDPDVLATLGIDERVITATRDAFDRSGEAAAVTHVSEDAISRLMFSGDPDPVRAHVERVRERGYAGVAVIAFGDTDLARDTLRRFAEDVVARIDR